jgi:hypothetical protein
VAAGESDERDAESEHTALHRDQCGEGVPSGLAGLRPAGDADHRKRARRDDHASPLAAPEPETEEPLRQHGEEDESA